MFGSSRLHTAVKTALAALCATASAAIGLGALPAGASTTTANLGGCVRAGQFVRSGEFLAAAGYQLVMQSDGNLVEYTASGRPLWDSQTFGHPGAVLALQASDGNLVVYSATGAALWSAYVTGAPRDQLCLQSDANVVIYSQSNAALWATNSGVAPRGNVVARDGFPAGQCTYWAEAEAGAFQGAFPAIHGDAHAWATSAAQNGYLVGATPRVGSIVVFQPSVDGAGSVGHVAWVTEVYPAQNAITISEMNFKGLGVVDTRRVAPAFGVNGIQYVYLNP